MSKKIFVFIFFLIIFFAFGNSVSKAIAPVPAPGKIPCTSQSNPEYNSDRPYQASPCGDSPKAVFCGNDLIITEGVTKTRTSNFADTMSVNIPVNKTYTVSVKDMYFPIMGNTEKINNSQLNGPMIDDATRMNEYVSSYLNGTTDQAEYGQTETSKVVNFSGPIKKLLPQAIQEAQRINTIKNTTTVSASDDEDSSETTSVTSHNQIVVCYEKPIPLLPYWLTNLFGTNAKGLGKAKPIECYKGDNSGAQGSYLRLNSWDSSPFEVAVGEISTFLAKTVSGPILGQLISSTAIADRWPKKIPPLPWEFTDTEKYTKAYNEWRGDLCAYVNLPVLGKKLFCAGIPNVTNSDYADLFPYIPLANTTDKAARMPINGDKAQIQSSGGTVITGKESQVLQHVNIYFPHTQESADLSKTLNQTYIPAKGTNNTISATTTEDNSLACRVANVRSNDGDNLFPEVPPESYIFTAKFTITEIPCSPPVEKQVCPPKNGDSSDSKKSNKAPQKGSGDGCYWERSQKCNGEVTITAPTITKTPYADKIWQTTTAGNSSTFRKIFPKVQEGAPITCIPDIPTVTNAVYNLDSVTGTGETGTSPLAVKGPGGKSDGNPAQVYFPHIGSVYDYFLKGIQTALRPKGYGEPIESGTLCTSATAACGEWESKLKDSGGACGICNAPIGELAKKILTAAGTAYNVPASNIWAAMKHEGGDWTEFGGFTDDNVRKWSNSVECGGEPMPRCDNDSELTQPPFGFIKKWFYLGDGTSSLWTAVQAIDPSRDTQEKVSRCNFLDAAFASAKLLRQGSSMTVAGTSCGQYSFDSTQPASCSDWTDAKVAQSQVGYGGQCPDVGTYETVPYKISDIVGWETSAQCSRGGSGSGRSGRGN